MDNMETENQNPEELNVHEKLARELQRRKETGEIEPVDYELNYIEYLQQMGLPLTRKDIGNHAIVINPDQFESLDYLEFINANGEIINVDLADEDMDKSHSLIIFPEEIGEEVQE